MAFFNLIVFKPLRKRWAIRSYVRRLPALLRRDYGFSQSYTPAQIRAAIDRHGLDTFYTCYALAMFATPDDFAQYHLNLGETCDYDAMRNNIAVAHFHGNTAFAHSDFGGAPHETIGASVTYPETHAHHHGGDGGQ